LFAAGARRVLIPRIPALVLDSSSAIDKLPPIVEPHGIALTAVHPMGGLGLGDDPGISVMQSTGEHHALRGLFAADGSLFPSSIGVPPQLSIYALARRVASFVSKRLG
jgi:choline dehydrogenase-like flavoprotein